MFVRGEWRGIALLLALEELVLAPTQHQPCEPFSTLTLLVLVASVNAGDVDEEVERIRLILRLITDAREVWKTCTRFSGVDHAAVGE